MHMLYFSDLAISAMHVHCMPQVHACMLALHVASSLVYDGSIGLVFFARVWMQHRALPLMIA